MKKIGIITYHYFYNYGTMLQAFALQSSIEKNNVECEIIDYRFCEKTKITKSQLIIIRLKRALVYIKEFKRVRRTLAYKNKINTKRNYFDEFANNYFKLSKVKYQYHTDLNNNPPVYDIYITGSDQTWSPKIGFNPALFLDFASEKSIKAAYAPSIGVTSFSDEESFQIKEYLKSYDFISCRERLGSDLLSKTIGKDVPNVIDPTLLLEAKDWRKISVSPKYKKPYILCYFLGNRKYYRDFAKKLEIETGYDLYFIPVHYLDFEKKNNLLYDCGPSEFLGLIDNAAIVCTDSFHGMAFCVNFNKTFYGFVKHHGDVASGDNSRIYDFLNKFGLTDRLLSSYKGEAIHYSSIDYSNVNDLLDEERKFSRTYLDKIIG